MDGKLMLLTDGEDSVVGNTTTACDGASIVAATDNLNVGLLSVISVQDGLLLLQVVLLGSN